MDSLPLAVSILALAVGGHGVVWLFVKKPRTEMDELVARMSGNENQHRLLEINFIKSSVALGVKVDQLGVEVSGLTIAVKELTRQMDSGNVGRPKRHDRET